MADFTQCQKGPDMVLSMESMEWLERATRKEYGGCSVCKHNFQVFEDAWCCEIEQTPFKGRLFCGRWAE